MQPPPPPITRIPFVIFPCRRCRRDRTTEGTYKKAILPGWLRVAEFKRLLSGRRALLPPHSDQHVVYIAHTDTQLTVLTRECWVCAVLHACTFLWISYFVYIAFPARYRNDSTVISLDLFSAEIKDNKIHVWSNEISDNAFIKITSLFTDLFPYLVYSCWRNKYLDENIREMHVTFDIRFYSYYLFTSWQLSDCHGN